MMCMCDKKLDQDKSKQNIVIYTSLFLDEAIFCYLILNSHTVIFLEKDNHW